MPFSLMPLIEMIRRRNPRTLLRIISTTAVSLLAAAVAAEPTLPQFALTDLGRMPHVSDDIAPGLGANGSIAAWAAKPGGGFQVVYRSGQPARPVILSLPDKDLLAAGVTAGGMVVGLAKDPLDLRFTRAFSWNHGTMTLLPALGGAYASAYAVSASGWIVGTADRADGLHHACLWQTGAVKDLGTLPGGDFSAATGLNAQGEIVGISNAAANGRSHAVIWQGDSIQSLGLLPGGSVSAARAINAHGDVVGWADIYGGVIHAALWRGGKTLDLGTLGDDPASAWGINDAGQVVGYSSVGPNKMHAFFWQHGRMSDLNDMVAAAPGWILENAYRISNRGWILGAGSFHGEAHLFLLRPATATGEAKHHAR